MNYLLNFIFIYLNFILFFSCVEIQEKNSSKRLIIENHDLEQGTIISDSSAKIEIKELNNFLKNTIYKIQNDPEFKDFFTLRSEAHKETLKIAKKKEENKIKLKSEGPKIPTFEISTEAINIFKKHLLQLLSSLKAIEKNLSFVSEQENLSYIEKTLDFFLKYTGLSYLFECFESAEDPFLASFRVDLEEKIREAKCEILKKVKTLARMANEVCSNDGEIDPDIIDLINEITKSAIDIVERAGEIILEELIDSILYNDLKECGLVL